MRKIPTISGILIAFLVTMVVMAQFALGNQGQRNNAFAPDVALTSITPYPKDSNPVEPASPPPFSGHVPIEGIPALTPPVSSQSVRTYLGDPANQMHGVHGQNLIVKDVQFLTTPELKAALNDGYLDNFSPGQRFTYVTFTGDFLPEEDIPAMHSGYAVFDASTGNVIMSGEVPDKK